MHNRLKAFRKKLKMSQNEVAVKLGISRSTLSLIESGNRKVRAEELPVFAKLYNVSIDDLIYGDNSDISYEQLKADFESLSDEKKVQALQFIKYLKTQQ